MNPIAAHRSEKSKLETRSRAIVDPGDSRRKPYFVWQSRAGPSALDIVQDVLALDRGACAWPIRAKAATG